MANGKKRKVYGVVLMSATAIFGADKLLLGVSDPASAKGDSILASEAASVAASEPSDAMLASGAAAAQAGQIQTGGSGRLAQALAALADKSVDASGLLDARVREARRAQQASVEGAATGLFREPAPVFPDLEVSSVLLGSSSPSAVVNGQVVSVGNSIKGATLIRVETDGVEFQMGGATKTFRTKQGQ